MEIEADEISTGADPPLMEIEAGLRRCSMEIEAGGMLGERSAQPGLSPSCALPYPVPLRGPRWAGGIARSLLQWAALCVAAGALLGAFFLSQTNMGRTAYRWTAVGLAGESYGKLATPLVMLSWPVMVAAAAAAAAGVRRRFSLTKLCGVGPWLVAYWGAQAAYLGLAYYRHSQKQHGLRLLAGTANSLAILGLINLSLFMIPVSRHCPLLVALNVPMESAIAFHRLAGRTSIVATLVHGLLYAVYWLLRDDNLFTMLLPPLACFSGADRSPVDCHSECECHHLLVNFSGLVAGLLFLAILISSIEWVRRRYYRVFYCCHVIFALSGCAVAVIHWGRLLVYVLPAVVLHALSTGLWTWEKRLFLRNAPDGTSSHLVALDNTRGIYELTIAIDQFGSPPLPGQWVRIFDLNSKDWIQIGNPISVCYFDHSHNAFKCFIRAVGPSLRSLVKSENMRCLVEGYHGSVDPMGRWTKCSGLVLIAGGIGVTPLICTLQGLCSEAHQSHHRIESVQMIWACRDEGLVTRILPTLETIIGSAPRGKFSVTVKIFQTGGEGSCMQESHEPPASSSPLQPVAVNSGAETKSASAFMPSSLMLQDSSALRRCALALSYVVAMGGSSVAVLMLYGHGHSLAWRLWMLIVVYCTCYLFSLPCCMLLRYLQGRECCMIASNTQLVAQDDPLPLVSTSCPSSIELLRGRPDFGRLEPVLATSHNIGVMICGPEGLNVAARQWAQNGSSSTSRSVGSACRRSNVLIYEEVFEW